MTQSTAICQMYGTDKGCKFGNNCKFKHQSSNNPIKHNTIQNINDNLSNLTISNNTPTNKNNNNNHPPNDNSNLQNDNNTNSNNNTTQNDQNDNKTNDIDNINSDTNYVTSFPASQILYDRAYGCCIGAAIGDSIGSYCEFQKHPIAQHVLNMAMTMPGGGTWGSKVITGQVTDDTELAISLAYGLMNIIGKTSKERSEKIKEIEKNNKKNLFSIMNKTLVPVWNQNDNDNGNHNNDKNIFDLRSIANEYRRWRDSSPFDMGYCTRATLAMSPNVINMKNKAYQYNIEKDKQYKGGGNIANGSLMRCMPLCLYGYKLNENNLYKLMKQDASLTHSNEYIYFVDTCYAIMIQSLLTANINNNNRNKDAYNIMYNWLKKQTKNKKLNKNKNKKIAKIILNDWLKDVNGNNLNNFHSAIYRLGFVKIAFQRCCYHLLRGSSFVDAIKSTVGEGGDTDTNACIVGGIMGAYHGLTNIPNEYINNIYDCNPLNQKRDIFQAKWYFKDNICKLLIDNAPNNNQFKCKKYD